MVKNLSKKFILLLLIGITIRILTISWSFEFRENTDILRWKDWGRIAFLHSSADTYKPDYLTFGTLANNLPPGSLFTVNLAYRTNLLISKIALLFPNVQEGSLAWFNNLQLILFLKLRSFLADIAIAFLIYFFVKKRAKEKNALLASACFFLNPVIIYNSTFWGQTDAINNLLGLAALMLLAQKHYFKSIFSYLLSLFVKMSLLVFLPLFGFIFLIQREKKKIFLFFTFSLVLILLLTLPLTDNPLKWWSSFLNHHSLGEMQNITNFAFNFWWLLFKPKISLGQADNLFSFSEIRLDGSPDSNLVFGGLKLAWWGYLLFFLFLIPLIVQVFKSKTKILQSANLFLFFSLAALLGFLFLPRMHERYLYPLFPSLAVYLGLKNKYFTFFFAFSLLNLLNLYLVWHPMRLQFFSYTLMNNQNFQWLISLGIVFTAIAFYLKSLRNSLRAD